MSVAQIPGNCDPRKGRYEADGDIRELGLANALKLASASRNPPKRSQNNSVHLYHGIERAAESC